MDEADRSPDEAVTRRPDPLAPLPPLRERWRALSATARTIIVVAPLVLTAIICLVDVPAGVTVGVFVVGCELVTAVFVKNRTDRQNAALADLRAERGGRPGV